MSRNRSNFEQTIKKFALSAFVVVAFVAYAIHERLTNSNSASTASNAGGGQQDASTSGSGNSTAADTSSQAPASSAASSSSSGSTTLKDGTYTGQTIDVNYGLVQIQTTVQNGKIAAVQFLQYPNDRRTSQRINAIAMPYLQQEAIQAQSANVDIISGATLTSEGFQMSLQSALASAH